MGPLGGEREGGPAWREAREAEPALRDGGGVCSVVVDDGAGFGGAVGHEVGSSEERTLRARGEEEERGHARSSRGGFKSRRSEAGGGRGTPAVSRDWKGKKNIVLSGTHVLDPLNGRKRTE